MSERGITESVIEQAAIAWFESVGWTVRNGTEIAPGESGAERADYGQVVLERRLSDALARLNPDLPAEALEGDIALDKPIWGGYRCSTTGNSVSCPNR